MSKIKTVSKPLIKLDISYGVPQPPYERVKGLNTAKYPWPLKDASVEEALCAFMFNRIPGADRYKFMDELWRVLVPGGKCLVIVPYWSSPRAIQDPLSAWPPLCEQSFMYFNKQFREVNKEPTVCICDFDAVAGHALDPETQAKNDDLRAFYVKHYLNSANDLHVTLTKRA